MNNFTIAFDDYFIVKSYSEYYSINSKAVSSALNARHLRKKKLPLASSAWCFNGYHFSTVSTFSFIAGGYSFFEHEFHYEHPSAIIEGIYFYIYYTDSGKIAAKFYEKVKPDNRGNFKLHILYDQKDPEHKQLNIHFCSIINCSLKSNKTLELIEPHVSVLQKSVLNLPSFEELDIEPPHGNVEVIYLPIEGTYNAKFFSRLFLLRQHFIENIIISEFDMIQYQIPVKADNESIILLIYGTHLLGYIIAPEIMTTALGTSMCDQTNTDIREKSPIVNSILSVRELVESAPLEKDLITHNTLYIMFEQLVSILFSWIDATITEAKNAYRRSNYNQVKWVSEYKLFNLVNLWYQDAIFQFSPIWLDKQSIDIFLPSKRLGIEYQGQQHFESVEYFGGDKHHLDNAKRDQKKLRSCKENDVTLLYWKYDQRVTFSAVSKFLNKRPTDILSQLESFKITPVETILGKIQTYAQSEKKRKCKEKKTEQARLIEVIRQYSNTGAYLAEYSTMKSAAIQSGTNQASIQKCLVGNRKTAGGYIWRREKRESKPRAIEVSQNTTHMIPSSDHSWLPKPVVQINPRSGEIIKVHDSINQAAKSVGVHSKGIRDVISGKQKTAGGYSWQFANQDKENNH